LAGKDVKPMNFSNSTTDKTESLKDGNCQHSCRKSHSEITNVSASITESFSGFNQT